jgi:hypothetical protein
MNIYLDDDSAKASLVVLLRKAGHQVVIPSDAGIAGASDPRHLIYAVQQNLLLLTGLALAAAGYGRETSGLVGCPFG